MTFGPVFVHSNMITMLSVYKISIYAKNINHTMVDLVTEFPSSKLVTTFLKGGFVWTWRSFADITTVLAGDTFVMATLE